MASPDTPLSQLRNAFTNVTGLPVINAQGQLVGVVSKSDLTKAGALVKVSRGWAGGWVGGWVGLEIACVRACVRACLRACVDVGRPCPSFPRTHAWGGGRAPPAHPQPPAHYLRALPVHPPTPTHPLPACQDVMSTPPIAARPTATVTDAAALMLKVRRRACCCVCVLGGCVCETHAPACLPAHPPMPPPPTHASSTRFTASLWWMTASAASALSPAPTSSLPWVRGGAGWGGGCGGQAAGAEQGRLAALRCKLCLRPRPPMSAHRASLHPPTPHTPPCRDELPGPEHGHVNAAG